MELLEVTSPHDWESLKSLSSQKPVLLLKHSTTCPISANAWKAFRKFHAGSQGENLQTAFVKVIESRPVSLQIAKESGVEHQSPQAILFKDGKAVWNTSHWNITEKALQVATR